MNSVHRILKIRILLLKTALAAVLLSPLSGMSQFYNGSNVSFGKNRVQHQVFNWQFMRADQYDVYFYPTGKALAQYVYCTIPQYIAEIEGMLRYSSRNKIQIIVYNTQADFRESNFAYDNDDFYNQGGITNVYGSKMYVYFDGNRAHFDRMIRSGIMNIYVHWLIQGTSVGANMSYDYLMNVPNWFFNGLASFYGEAWNSEVDAHVKDGIFTKQYKDFGELSSRDATYAGHSFWKYLTDTYGNDIVARSLYAIKATKNVARGFSYATGVPYKTLMENWLKYFSVMYYPDLSREMPSGKGLVRKPKPKRLYDHVVFSADSGMYAFVTNEYGQVRVWLQRADRSRPECILRKYSKTEENPDLSYPLLAWHPQDSILGMTFESQGHCYYRAYDLRTRKWQKRFLVDVEKITAWCYADDGKTMLFSGFKNGQSDIFIYSFLARSFQNLTNDFYDDYAPIFLKGNDQIVFSSNRPRDSVGLADAYNEAEPLPAYDLFLFQYGRKDPALLRVTESFSANEYDALRIDDRRILFLGDNDGIVNQYAAEFDSVVSRVDTAIHYAFYADVHPITDAGLNTLCHNYDAENQTTARIMLKNGVRGIYMQPLDLSEKTVAAPSPFYRGILADRKTPPADTLQTDSVAAKPKCEPPVASGYRVQYSINKVITQADFSFLNTSYQQFEGGTSPIYLNTGFNALFMLGINDLFEDYRITGGFRVGVDNNYEFMLSYENLSRRLDRQIVAYRQALTSDVGNYLYKQQSNSLFYILKFPFDKVNSLRFTIKGRYETNVVSALSDNTLKMPDTRHLWAGVKLEYIFDSSKELCVNLWRGTKLKLFAEYEQRAEKDTRSLFVVGVDARRSFKIYRNMTFAVRLAGSTNLGSARLVYYMGGVDNWINAKFDSDITVDESKGYAYQTLATNMRGFKQNIRNGTSFALLSAELRVPFVQLIAGHQVSSDFLNSLQLNLFGDVGTAWTGLTPYSDDNSLYTRQIDRGPVSVVVKRQVDPIIGGFGTGLRFSLFGYFLRLDYAWGVEDLKIADPKGMFLFSIGTDF